ncbi:MAG: hypothetical protein COV67_08845 [Nitrospinae bacterium CG11_big_fil_rev_8_21_14_0_20_56_8]|nr:MAG: hypothetical protein COV67_08845 [Nitrospinae bacterium CG11_big_fil_rev_8_21_14_0_20_56_8]
MSGIGRRLERRARRILWAGFGQLFGHENRTPVPLPLPWEEIGSALVVRPDRLGDVVLATPVFASLKQCSPRMQVTALVDRAYAPLLTGNPNVDRVLAFDRRRPWEILSPLRTGRFDLSLTLNKKFSATASLLAWLGRARYRAGYRHEENAWLHNIALSPDTPPRHEVQNNLELLRALGATHLDERPRIHFTGEEEQTVDRILKETRRAPELPCVLIKIGTRVPEWGWRPEKFRAVASALVRGRKAEVLLVQGPGEETLMRETLARMEVPVGVLPPLPLKQLALAMKKSQLLFCSHTGIMHLASAVGTPALVIFKHGEIARWGPVNNRHVVLEERNHDGLHPESVLEHLDRLLNPEHP